MGVSQNYGYPFKGVILGLYRDNGKENGFYYLGFRVYGLEFPKIRGTILGVPVIRTIVYWGLYWGPPILGNYNIVALFQGLKLRVSLTLCPSVLGTIQIETATSTLETLDPHTNP